MAGTVALARGLASAALASGVLWAGVAAATPLSGSSSATFDTLSACPAAATCTISPDNVVTWYKNNEGSTTELTLTAADNFAISATPGQTVEVAELTWNVGTTTISPDFNYNLTLTFTSPSGASSSTTLDLVVQSGNVGIKDLDLSDLSNLDITFADGSSLDDFQYAVAPGNGTLVTPKSGKDSLDGQRDGRHRRALHHGEL